MKSNTTKKLPQLIRSMRTIFLSGIAAVLVSLPATYADDTEIFFSQGSGSANPNILFVLDTSTSMKIADVSGGPTRMESLKSAMETLLGQSSDFNVGYMGLNGHKGGGSVRYPLSSLGVGGATSECPPEGCPEQQTIGRVSGADDDAYELLATGTVTTTGTSLPLGSLANTAANTNSGGPETTASSVAIASVVSADRYSDEGSVRRNNEAENLWFYWGTPDTHTTTRLAYRFDNVSIPPGANITDAKITFSVSNTSKQVGDVSAYIYAESDSTPAPYPGDTDVLVTTSPLLLENRNITNELVAWVDVPRGAGGTTVETPDLSQLLQEVTSLPGWATGNDVSIHFDAFDSVLPDLTATRNFLGVGAAADSVPVLTYTYTYDPAAASAGNANSGIVNVEATSHSMEFFNPSTQKVTVESSSANARLFTLDPLHELGQLGLRFENLGIPAGASITSATLKVHMSSATDNGIPIDNPDTRKFVASINAELSGTPATFAEQNIRDRTFTTEFVEWNDLTDIAGTSDTTGDLKKIFQELVSQSDWDEQSSAMLTLNPGSQHSADFTRTIDSSTATSPPVLEISWIIHDDIVSTNGDEVMTAMRFNYLHVPPGAKITSAVLKMRADKASNTQSSFTIAAEDTGNSEAFYAVDRDISTRLITDARETWTPEDWPSKNSQINSVDVSRLVQEVTDRTDWCGGNAISLLVTGTGFRETVAQEQSSVNAPSLVVTYDPNTVSEGSYCSNRSSTSYITSGQDDVLEQSTGNMRLTDTTLDMNAETSDHLGLRFLDVAVPQGTNIKNATLEISAAVDIPPGTAIKIEIQDSDNAGAFTTGSKNLSNRTYYSQSVNWNNLPAIAANESAYSTDISSLLTHVVNKSNWNINNSVVFRLTPLSDSGIYRTHSYEGNEALSARLIIYYEAERSEPTVAIKSNLNDDIQAIEPHGATPTVGQLYEAALYYTGGSVDYGRLRGEGIYAVGRQRVSHPDSYTGGSVYTPPDCTMSDYNNYNCREEEITGNPVYKSPITSQCQTNHLVLLSDGHPSTNISTERIKALTGTDTCITKSLIDFKECGVELVEWLYESDLNSSIPGKQNIVTHTVEFEILDPGEKANQFMLDLAEKGGGNYHHAENSSDLLNAFKSVFYFAQFKPSETARWPGNLKRYKVEGEEGESVNILDSKGALAINESTGGFKANTTSYWSTVADGGDVEKGGAASKLNLQARNVYTYTGSDNDLTAASNKISTANSDLDVALFNLPPSQEADPVYINALINWTAGQDPLDENRDGETNDYRTAMGDPMHSQPLLLSYATASGSKSIIYIGTNEGYLHAVDNASGLEQFAFVPPELLPNMRKFFANEPQSRRLYGLDGDITAWIDDKNSNGLIDKNETALLYVGMRRGGSKYYVLDISDYEKPALAYVIAGGTDTGTTVDGDPQTADGDYVELAQTWSKVVKTKVRDGSTIKDVIIFAGGYDGNQDPGGSGSGSGSGSSSTTDDDSGEFGADGSRSVDSAGRAIFIADALTGNLIWKTSQLDSDFSKMQYSIPSDLRVIDINSDGLVDQLYFGDMGGQVWRMDIDNGSDSGVPIASRISAGVIAELGDDTSANSIRFYYPPDVALVNFEGERQLAVSIGSGWRAHPLQTRIADRFYSFRLDAVFTAPTDSFGQIRYPKITDKSNDLLDVTDNLNNDMVGYKGWYINLEGNGEKALSASTTIDNKVIFTTYTPGEHSNEACSSAAAGLGAAYVVSVFNGDPVLDLESNNPSNVNADSLDKTNRKQHLVNSTIPTTPNVIFPTTGEPTVVIGSETLDSVKVDNFKRTTFWQEHVDDNS